MSTLCWLVPPPSTAGCARSSPARTEVTRWAASRSATETRATCGLPKLSTPAGLLSLTSSYSVASRMGTASHLFSHVEVKQCRGEVHWLEQPSQDQAGLVQHFSPGHDGSLGYCLCFTEHLSSTLLFAPCITVVSALFSNLAHVNPGFSHYYVT